MYLKTCWLENTGPISKFDVQAPFHADGRPKPIVLVGGNGSGKTTVLSYVADALVEMAKKNYHDVVPHKGTHSPFLRILGGGNQRVQTAYGSALLTFELDNDGKHETIFYR